MTLQVPTHTVLDIAGSAAEHTTTHDCGASPKYLVVCITGGKGDFDASVTVGGVALTKRASFRHGWFGRNDTRVMVYAITNSEASLPSGSQTLSVTTTASVTGGKAVVYSGSADGDCVVADSGTKGGLNADAHVTLESELESIAFGAFGSNSESFGVGGTNPTSTQAQGDGGSNNGQAIGRENDPYTGSRWIGIGLATSTSGAAVLIGEQLRARKGCFPALVGL